MGRADGLYALVEELRARAPRNPGLVRPGTTEGRETMLIRPITARDTQIERKE